MEELFDFKPDLRLEHEWSLWYDKECYKYYVLVRREYCNFKQLLDLTIRVPLCVDCMESDPFFRGRLPDIQSSRWREDVSWTLGSDTLRRVKRAIKKHEEIYFLCKRCGRELKPWETGGDDVYVRGYYLEDHFNFPLETPGKVNPSRRISNGIIQIYGSACFGCGAKDRKLHIDHILPRSKGGTSAFRNLQPLCDVCGQEKGDIIPEEVAIIDDMFFGPYPSDGYEGLFWE